ncbi:MAG: hypothetical protein O9282_00980 [Flavobacterium sp.]|nr:hypothetical protein [Flavobacterium sp.]MCZ8329863.1 hypothetical protein [Flavobacterium sp.]
MKKHHNLYFKYSKIVWKYFRIVCGYGMPRQGIRAVAWGLNIVHSH